MPDGTVYEVRRTLNNLRGVVRRTGVTGYQDRSARYQYEQATRAVLAFEDAEGIDAAAPYGDRLRVLRDEARAAGLLTDSEALAIDIAAVRQ